MFGCENYRVEIDTEIEPKIHVIGSGEDAYVILEYDLASAIHVVDSLEDLTPVDIFYFTERQNDEMKINLRVISGEMNYTTYGYYYIFSGNEYKGSKKPNYEMLVAFRDQISGFKWKIYDGDYYDEPIPDSEIKRDDDVKEEIEENEPSPKPEKKEGLKEL